MGVKRGEAFVDVGTLNGYRAALKLIGAVERAGLGLDDRGRPRPAMTTTMTAETTFARARNALGPWFHNLDLRGVRTAPDHFLGDYPAVKFKGFSKPACRPTLTGKSVLDIGANGGFYAMEMKRRGAARVLGIDSDDHYSGAGALRRGGRGPRHRIRQARRL